MKTRAKRVDRCGSLLVSLLPALSMLVLILPMPVRAELITKQQTPQLENDYAYSFDLSAGEDEQEVLEMTIANLKERIRRNPEDGLDRAQLAQAYLKMARLTGESIWYERAEQEAKQSLANLPFYNNGAIIALAKLAEANHDFATAIRLSEQASNNEAIAIQVTSNLAIAQLDKAATNAEKLVELAPTLGSLTLRSLVYTAQGNHAAAKTDLEQAIAVEQPSEQRGSALARSLLARQYFKHGDLHMATQLNQQALNIVPDYPLALLSLGEINTRTGDYAAAIQVYQRVNDPLALLGIARAQALSGNEAEAKRTWQQAETLLRQKVAQNPLDHGRELAQLLLERKETADLDEAIALLQAEVRNRQDAQTLDTLAWALSRADRWQEAEQVINQALAKGTREPIIFYRAAMIATALQNPAQAEQYLQMAGEMDPTFDRQPAQNLALIGLQQLP
jgi:Flp pilus assembly protein TadD